MTALDWRALAPFLAALAVPYLIIEGARAARLGLAPSTRSRAYVRRRRAAPYAFALAWGCLCAALGGFGGLRNEPELVSEARVALLVDVSNSMSARDQGDATRLEAASSLARRLRSVSSAMSWSLHAFKGAVATLSPFSYDEAAFESALAWLGPGLSDAPGSELGLALRAVGEGSEGASIMVVVLTDGADTGGRARVEARRLGEAGVRMVFVGVGGEAPSPVYGEDGRPLIDARGERVAVAMDRAGLEDLARASGGRFVGLSDPAAFAALAAILEEHGAGAGSWRIVRRVGGAPAWLYLAAALCLGLGVVLTAPPLAPGAKARKRKRRAVSAALAVWLGLSLGSCSRLGDGLDTLRANADFKRGLVHDALAIYMELGPDALGGVNAYNLANAFYALGEAGPAEGYYALAAASSDSGLAAAAWHNRGVAYYEGGRYAEARDAFKEALKLRPSQIDSARGYELAMEASSSLRSDADLEQARAEFKGQGGASAAFSLASKQDKGIYRLGVANAYGGADH